MVSGIFCWGQPLASGSWVKFSVTSDGIYKIDYSLLQKAGINPDKTNPQNIQLFMNGNGMLPQPNNAPRQSQLKEIAIFVQGEADATFNSGDYILFFGQGPDAHYFDTLKNMFYYENNLYSDKNYYFLTVGTSPGKRLQTSGNQIGNFPVVNQFDDFGYYETDQYNILSSGREWFGEQFNSNASITIQFNLPGIIANSPIKFVSDVMAQSYTFDSSFKIYFNNVQILDQDIALIPNTEYAIKGDEVADTLAIDPSTVAAVSQPLQNIEYQYVKASSGTSIGYLNYFIFSLKRTLALYDNQTIFTSSQSLSNAVSTFQINALPQGGLIWDVTDPFGALTQSYSFTTNQSSFSVSTNSLKTFVAFTLNAIPAPTFESSVPNQNLSALPTPNLLIITYPDFQSQAQRLASYRESNYNISVQTVTPQQIYNEYSGGKQDVTALRDFVRDVYSRGPGVLTNLLFFGRCSYDYKNRVPNNTNFVPTYESRDSLDPLETYSSDDYFAFLQPTEGEWPENPAIDYSMDIGVGRISVVSLQEATDVVNKLIDYETNGQRFGPWRTDILFVADDGDDNLHQSSADQLATNIDNNYPQFITKKIYLDQYKQIDEFLGQFSPETNAAIDRALTEGVAIVNYTGHGDELQWAQEDILDEALVESLKNGPMYPLFVTATCAFGRHDDPFQISSGERVLLQPYGGGIGLVSAARPVNSSSNYQLNQAFYNALFVKSNGAYRDLGSIFRDTKNNSLNGVANRNYSLIGDPSTHLAFPKNQVVVDQLSTMNSSDTLEALSSAVVKGEVQQAGVKQTNFNGEADITVFDQPASFTTLGNENPPFSYFQWSNALFRGKATVAGGTFQFEFTVPVNLETTIGQGKIELYANNGQGDASGVLNTSVGEASTSFPPDNTPPNIQLFMGDTTFVNGGIASPNTTLVVKLYDAHGIGISGFGNANNMTAVLDDSISNIINDFYTSDINDYTRGKALFPYMNLQKGKHTIVVDASDTYGNRTSSTINFVVTEGNLVISEFYNYPNPFSASTKTIFGFAHNRPGEDLDVELTITDLTGQVVDTQQYTVLASYTVVTLAQWDGTTVNGNKLSNGVYLGKLSVRSLLDGSKNQQFTKLIIVN